MDRLKRAAKLAPRDERILNNLALRFVAWASLMRPTRVLRGPTDELTGHLNIARMLERFGREDDAIKYYEGARSSRSELHLCAYDVLPISISGSASWKNPERA